MAGQTKVYVGVTCTGETNYDTDDLFGYVVEFDAATNTYGTAIFELPLNYPKGCALVNHIAGNIGCSWMAWSDNEAQTPQYQVVAT